MKRRILPAIVLILIAPLVAEVLPGSAPITQPGLLPFILLIYGPGALLIRELVRRAGRGWLSILLLGAAYGVIEEGLALQSLFNPNLYHASDWGGRILGINGVYAEAAITSHAVWSAAIPILATDILFPRTRTMPYLGRIGLFVTGAWYLLGVALLALLTRFSIAPGYWAPPFLLALTGAIAAILAGCALYLFKPAPVSLDRDAPPPLAILAYITLAGVVWHVLLAVLWRRQPVFAQWPHALVPTAGAMAVVGAVFWLVCRWAVARDWSDVHRMAVVCGAVISHSVMGCMIFHVTTTDRITIAVVGLAALLALVSRVQRTTCIPRAAANW